MGDISRKLFWLAVLGFLGCHFSKRAPAIACLQAIACLILGNLLFVVSRYLDSLLVLVESSFLVRAILARLELESLDLAVWVFHLGVLPALPTGHWHGAAAAGRTPASG